MFITVALPVLTLVVFSNLAIPSLKAEPTSEPVTSNGTVGELVPIPKSQFKN